MVAKYCRPPRFFHSIWKGGLKYKQIETASLITIKWEMVGGGSVYCGHNILKPLSNGLRIG